MIKNLLSKINAKYPLSPINVGEFSSLKANGMKFSIEAYKATGLGHVSVMRAKGFFGLMKMDTLMIVPKERDLPLYSYDRIFAMGNETLIVELYDTLTAELDLSALDRVKSEFSSITERDPGVHWYDNIKLPQSISKKGKKKDTPKLDELAEKHFDAYITAPTTAVNDFGKKHELSSDYVNGLVENGGPSTDVFKKSLGIEKTTALFKKVLFGV